MEKKKKTPKKNLIKEFSILKNKKKINWILLVLFTAILFFISVYRIKSNKLNLEIGDVLNEDIVATKDLVDKVATNRLKSEARERVEPRYRIAPSIQMNMKDTIKELLDTARDLKSETNISMAKKAEILRESTSMEISQNELYTLIRMDYKDLNTFENTIMDIVNQVMGSGIREEELEYEKENIRGIFETLNITLEEKQIGLTLLMETIKPNEFIDIMETQRRRNQEEAKVEDVIIKANQFIAFKGDLVDEYILDLARESGLLKDENSSGWKSNIGSFLLLIIGVAAFVGFIYYFHNEIMDGNMLMVILIITLFTIYLAQLFNAFSQYMMPISVGALLIAILIDTKIAIFMNTFIAMYIGLILKLDMDLILMYILSGTIGTFLSMKPQQRYSILLNGLGIGLVNILTLISFALIKDNITMNLLVKILQVLVNGILVGILALGTLPLWENTFGILTPLKLLELSNPNQPLLKKLLLEAPGTYHHSILVGNLSEAGAEAIGANALIARVGAYYHDIGKTIRPYFFKENQFGVSNPHDNLHPLQSTKIITNHTTDGMILAKEHRLPREIMDIIDQHHGDTTVAYFYYKSKEENQDIDINKFKYGGQKPQTKEAAIVMLADSTEAAVRSIKEPTKEKISEMVNKIVKGKLNDGQLDECNITFKEINKITNTFINILMGIYHNRIEYPNLEIKEKEGV